MTDTAGGARSAGSIAAWQHLLTSSNTLRTAYTVLVLLDGKVARVTQMMVAGRMVAVKYTCQEPKHVEQLQQLHGIHRIYIRIAMPSLSRAVDLAPCQSWRSSRIRVLLDTRLMLAGAMTMGPP